MKKLNFQRGRDGETIASDFLIQKGYKIIEKNFHTKYGEIDLIVEKDEKLIFVEVKSKTGSDFGSPEEMINNRKLFQVRRTAEIYLLKNPDVTKRYTSFRIDAVCMVLNEDKSINRINHYENIGN